MNIVEFAEMIRQGLRIIYYVEQNGRYACSFDSLAEVLNDNMLTSTYGDGKTAVEAMDNYANRISGEVLVFNASGTNRMEYRVPQLRKM